MLFYLAGPRRIRHALQQYAGLLTLHGHTCTARWLTRGEEGLAASQVALAEEHDLRAAEAVIFFAEPPQAPATEGERHWAGGMALALDKRLLVIGYREHVFCSHPHVEFYSTWEEALHVLDHG